MIRTFTAHAPKVAAKKSTVSALRQAGNAPQIVFAKTVRMIQELMPKRGETNKLSRSSKGLLTKDATVKRISAS